MSLCFSKSHYLELVICIRAKKSNVEWFPVNTIFLHQAVYTAVNWNWNFTKLFGNGCYVWRKRATNCNFNFHTEDRFTYIIRDESCGRGIATVRHKRCKIRRSQLVLKAVSQWWMDERAKLGIKANLRFGIFKNSFGNLEYFPLNMKHGSLSILHKVRTKKILFHIEL